MVEAKNNKNSIIFYLMVILSIAFLVPIFIVLMNSFKGQFYISDAPFALPAHPDKFFLFLILLPVARFGLSAGIFQKF